MKRTVNVLSRLNWGTRACAVLALCATTAIALPAQTLTTLYSFCSQGGCTDGDYPRGHALQLLFPRRVHGRRLPPGGVGPDHQRGPLWDNCCWWGQPPGWHSLQNHPGRHADDAIQLLLPDKLHGRL